MALAETGLLNSNAYLSLEAKAGDIHYASLSRRRESQDPKNWGRGMILDRKYYIYDVIITLISGLGNKRTAAFSFENNFSYFPNKFAKAII